MCFFLVWTARADSLLLGRPLAKFGSAENCDLVEVASWIPLLPDDLVAAENSTDYC